MFAVKYPVSRHSKPGDCNFGLKLPTSFTSTVLLECSIFTCMPDLNSPLKPQVSYNATVGIKIGIENQRLWRLFVVISSWVRMRCTIASSTSSVPIPSLARQNLLCRDGKNVLELTFYLGDIRVWKVNLVNDWDDREIVVHRQVARHRLGSTLCGINHQQCTLTGAETAGNFVCKSTCPECRSGNADRPWHCTS